MRKLVMKSMKQYCVLIVLIMFNHISSMSLLNNLFNSNQSHETINEELIEKTKDPKHILIDISTLYQPNIDKAEQHILSSLGYSSHITYGIKLLDKLFNQIQLRKEEAKKKLFLFLESLDLSSIKLPTSKHTVMTPERMLPAVFSTFFLLQTKEEENILRTFIKEKLEKIDDEDSIKKALNASIELMFNADAIHDIMELNITLYNRAKKLQQADHQLILIGNIPSYAYENFIKKNKEKKIISLFKQEHIFISGNVQMLTSQKKFYTNIFEKLNIKPNKCIVINEKTENMQKAYCLGATIIKFKHYALDKKDAYEKFNTKLETALTTKKTVDDE